MKYLVSLVAIFSASVFAQATKAPGANMVGAPGSTPRASINERINQLDGNRDGMISRSEAAGYPKLAKAFSRIDINKDEQLSREELMAFRDKAKASRARTQ